jgi:hypothetical protein
MQGQRRHQRLTRALCMSQMVKSRADNACLLHSDIGCKGVWLSVNAASYRCRKVYSKH